MSATVQSCLYSYVKNQLKRGEETLLAKMGRPPLDSAICVKGVAIPVPLIQKRGELSNDQPTWYGMILKLWHDLALERTEKVIQSIEESSGSVQQRTALTEPLGRTAEPHDSRRGLQRLERFVTKCR